MSDAATILHVDTRLVRLPVEPPRGDAIQKFDALELPIVEIADRSGRRGVGFGYTIGTGGTAMLALLQHELLPQLVGIDSRKIVQIMERLRMSIHALTPGCIASTALAAIDVALWDLAARRANAPLYMFLGGAHDESRQTRSGRGSRARRQGT
jgi:L-alanine-DL-glutamate epimerase-like enolase superfamily enzyme